MWIKYKYKYINEIEHYYWKYFICNLNYICYLNNFLYYYNKKDKFHIEIWPHYTKVYFICG